MTVRTISLWCLPWALACTQPDAASPPGAQAEAPAPLTVATAATVAEQPPGEQAKQAEPAELTVDDLPPGQTPEQKHGREIFTHNCVKCHVEGLGDAPLVIDHEAWAPRVAKPREELYQHAMDGFWGDVGEMPARGDNEDLTDEELRHAVEYIVSIHSS